MPQGITVTLGISLFESQVFFYAREFISFHSYGEAAAERCVSIIDRLVVGILLEDLISSEQ